MSTIRETAEALMSNEIKAFNTGRMYSVNGQRIAWTVLPNGKVAVRDIDRMIDYVLQVDFNGPLDYDYRRMGLSAEDGLVLQAYDRHDGTMGGVWSDEFRAVSPALREAAEKVPSAGGPKRLGS